jgi:hypothetical protein
MMKHYIERSLSFSRYIELLDVLLAQGKTTGPKQTEEMVEFGRINRRRMNRLEKTIKLGEDVRDAVAGSQRRLIWLVITEGWCGDAAQNIPAIERIASLSDKIETRYILRDENPELMDQFLTEGARSIPKLIALDPEKLEVLGTWGARPGPAQELYVEMKALGLEKALIMENMQRWYNADKAVSIQKEFAQLIRRWGLRPAAAAAA